MKRITLFAFIIFFLSCSKEQYTQVVDPPPGCNSAAFTFDKDVNIILSANCNFPECHAAGGVATYDFTDYDVVANRARAGTLEYRIDLPADDPQHMPVDMVLSDCDYFIIKSWIHQGYPEK